MKILGASLLLATLLQSSATFAAGKSCSVVFDQPPSQQEIVDRVIYDLANMRLNLDIAKAQGLNSIAMTGIVAEYNAKERAVISDLESRGIMTRAEVLQKMSLLIAEIQKEDGVQDKKNQEEARKRKEQEIQIKKVLIDGQTAHFSKVAAGNFKMGPKKTPVTLTKDFEIMATTVTQFIWKKVAHLANEKFDNEYSFVEDPFPFKDDSLPATGFNLIEFKVWIEALNALSQRGEPALEKFIAGHRQGDIYDLPTEAQWEYVLRGRGKLKDSSHFGNNSKKLGAYAWTRENSDGQVQPVAQRQPLQFENIEVYDMLGNVWEHTKDVWVKEPAGGVDPHEIESLTPSRVTIRGGAASTTDSGHFLEIRSVTDDYAASPFRSIRLIREVRD